MPALNRATKNTQRELLKPWNKNPKQLPRVDTRIMFLRPNLSDNRPGKTNTCVK